MTIDHIHRYGHFVSHVANDTEVAVGDILGDPADPVVAVWIGHVQFRGTLSTVLGRLEAATDLLERAGAIPSCGSSSRRDVRERDNRFDDTGDTRSGIRPVRYRVEARPKIRNREGTPMTDERPTKDVMAVVKRVKAELGDEWAQWPGGWPGQAELAIIDSVFSVQARYGTETSGVRRCIALWRDHRGAGASPLDDLHKLADLVDQPDELARIFDNKSKLPGGTPKSLAVAEAARALIGAGASSSADLTHDRPELGKAWRSVHGLGDVTWTYALMLLGVQGVKADTMIRRFVGATLQRDVGSKEAQQIVQSAAGKLGVGAIQLDHAIWQWQRKR